MRSAAAPATFEHEGVAGDAALLAPLGRCRRDIVGGQNGADLEPIGRRHLGRHVEVHAVAGIVAVEEQHARAAIGRSSAGEDRIGRGRGKDVADRDGVGEPAPDQPREGRLVAGAAPHHEADLAGSRALDRDQRTAVPLGPAQVARMRRQHALDHLVHDVGGVVDQLLGFHAILPALQISTTPKRRRGPGVS